MKPIPESYHTPVSDAEFRMTERGSRFFGYAAPAADEAAALAVVAARSRLHHDASHHCYAFRLGEPPGAVERSSDAGEPSGTAGRPILTRSGERGFTVVWRW